MKLQFFRLLLLLGTAALAQAHFVFVVPDASGKSAIVFLNEELKPTAEVDVTMIGGTKLSLRGADGQETPLKLVKGEHAYTIELPSDGTRLIHGATDLGLMQTGQEKPYLLIYHPKAIVGDPFSHEEIVGNETPVEIVPLGKPGAVKLELLVHGKAQPDTEITILLPDGTQKKVKTNQNGQTEAMAQTGRYGAWARYWEQAGGERDGRKYDETHHYATLVFDAQLATGASSDTASAAAKQPAAITATRFATLPEATSSFGEVVSDGWLYVYGGHIAHTHSYSTEAVSGRFERLKLSDGTWEKLPDGPGLQGMNLAVYQGKIYRIGGMRPRNKPGGKEAIFSVANCARFNPATKKWESLPRLPEPRSSHDVVVIGSKLIVVGGWTLKGSPAHTEWRDTLAVLDLSAKKPKWKSTKQPFKRRALIAAALNGKMYVMGGFDDQEKIIRDVSIYDPATDQWTSGPALPGDEMNGFSPAACVHDGDLYVSVADGSLYRLNSRLQQWEKAGTSTPRLAHRIGSWGDDILISGGAAKGNNFDLIESVAVGENRAR